MPDVEIYRTVRFVISSAKQAVSGTTEGVYGAPPGCACWRPGSAWPKRLLCSVIIPI